MRCEIDIAEQQDAHAAAVRLHRELAHQIACGEILAFVEAHRRVGVADLEDTDVLEKIRMAAAFAAKSLHDAQVPS